MGFQLKQRVFVIYGAGIFELSDEFLNILQDNELHTVSLHELVLENTTAMKEERIAPILMPFMHYIQTLIDEMTGNPEVTDDNDEDLYDQDEAGDDSLLF